MTNTLALPRNPRFVDFRDRGFTAQEVQLLAASPSLVRLDFKHCAIGDDEVRQLCHLPKLQSMWLEGTAVTDAALAHLARLPKLDWVILDDTAITGAGFAAFCAHGSLRTVSIRNTGVTDAAMPLLAAIPGLSLVLLGGSAVTEAGLMALAAHPTVIVGGDHAFEPGVLARFEERQRQLACRTPPGFEPVQADEDEARAVLLGFMAAISEWEREVDNAERACGDGTMDWKVDQVRAAFAAYCTAKDRKYGRPNALSISRPPTYEGMAIFATEWLDARKVLFYARDNRGVQERFMLVKKAGRWLLDHKQRLGDGWGQAFL